MTKITNVIGFEFVMSTGNILTMYEGKPSNFYIDLINQRLYKSMRNRPRSLVGILHLLVEDPKTKQIEKVNPRAL